MKTFFDTPSHTDQLNAKSALISMKVIYFVMIFGLLAFVAVTFQISSSDFKFNFDTSDPILIVAIVLFMMAVPTSFFFSKILWRNIGDELTLKDKILKYQSGFIIRLASCEGVGLFSIVGFMLSNNLIYLVQLAVILMVIFFYYPSVERIGKDLFLTDIDMENLKNKNYQQHQH
jgi:hypothetical protein